MVLFELLILIQNSITLKYWAQFCLTSIKNKEYFKKKDERINIQELDWRRIVIHFLSDPRWNGLFLIICQKVFFNHSGIELVIGANWLPCELNPLRHIYRAK